jgi:hypothetical protein
VRRFIPYYRSALLAALLSNSLMLVTGMVTSVIYDKVIPTRPSSRCGRWRLPAAWRWCSTWRRGSCAPT